MKRLIALLVLLATSLSLMPVAAQDVQSPDFVSAWREDLAYLMERIDRMHPDPFRGTPEADFMGAVAALDAGIPEMTDNEIRVSLMRLVSSLVDGHSNLLPFLQTGQFTAYPLDLYQFSDGVYVVDAAPDYADTIGARLVQINGTDVQSVVDFASRLVPRDNDSGGRVLLPLFMMTAEVLQGGGFVDDLDQPNFLLEYPDRSQSILDPARIPAEEFIEIFPQHYRLPPDPDVAYLSHLDEPLWLTTLEDGRTVYAQHNATVSLGTSVSELRDALEDPSVERLILDLRFNGGGDIANLRQLMLLLDADARFHEPGGLVVLTGRNTFSAAVVFLIGLQRDLTVFTVGEPTGGSPTMFENGHWINLPNSGLRIAISTRARQDVPESDTRRQIDPDLLIALSSEDYFAGRDPVLDAALAYTP